jgi:hypothetical protein
MNDDVSIYRYYRNINHEPIDQSIDNTTNASSMVDDDNCKSEQPSYSIKIDQRLNIQHQQRNSCYFNSKTLTDNNTTVDNDDIDASLCNMINEVIDCREAAV